MKKLSSISTALGSFLLSVSFSLPTFANINVSDLTQKLPEGSNAGVIAKNIN